MPKIIPIRDLKDTATISNMCRESAEPIYITKNGYGDMVIMSMDAYEKMAWLNDANIKLKEAEEDIHQGKVAEAGEALAGLRMQYGI